MLLGAPTAARAVLTLSLVPLSARSVSVSLTLLRDGRNDRQRRPPPPPPPPPVRLTHFLAMRLGSPLLHAAVEAAQREILSRDENLKGCDVPAAKTHLTCFVLSLPTPSDVDAAKEALSACSNLIEPGRPPPAIHLNGIGNFGQRVCFIKCDERAADFPRVASLVSGAADIFSQRCGPDAVSGLGTSWTPHVTLLKTSRLARHHQQKSKSKGRRPRAPLAKIRESTYAPIAETDFGVHELPTMELCAMQGEAADGFYMVEAALSLSLNHIE